MDEVLSERYRTAQAPPPLMNIGNRSGEERRRTGTRPPPIHVIHPLSLQNLGRRRPSRYPIRSSKVIGLQASRLCRKYIFWEGELQGFEGFSMAQVRIPETKQFAEPSVCMSDDGSTKNT